MDFEKLKSELDKSGKANRLMNVANSEDGKKIAEKLDADAVANAAKSGDAGALRNILQQVLSTEEGKRLAQQLGEAMK